MTNEVITKASFKRVHVNVRLADEAVICEVLMKVSYALTFGQSLQVSPLANVVGRRGISCIF